MGTLLANILLLLIALPAAIWFARDALVAKLSPWKWAIAGVFSVAVPPILLFRLGGLLSEQSLLRVEPRWGGMVGVSVIAVGWLTAYLIHKRTLKPKRVAIIGNSLNYVGGWLGLLIYMLFLSAGLILVTYGRDTYIMLEQLCPGGQMGDFFFRCAIASIPGAYETGLMFISVAGCLWAAIALMRKTASSIRIAGGILVCFILLGVLQLFEPAIDVAMSDNPDGPVTKGNQMNEGAVRIWNLVWLAYLTRSKRVREVYGQNF